MNKTSRQKILDYLKARPTTSAGDIQRTLHMSAANARHHLAEMEREGVIVMVGKQSAQGRGRPSLLYAAAEQAKRHNLDELSSALLQAIQQMLNSEQQEQVLAAAAQQIAKRTPQETAGRANLSQRLASAIQRLNEMGYQARWEARSTGPRLIFGHCPYQAILLKHPQLCRLDAAVLEQMLGSSPVQTAKREPTPAGLAQCVFLLKNG